MADGTCEYESKDQTSVYVKGYYDVPRNSSSELKAALATQAAKLYSDSNQHAKGDLVKASSTRQLQNVRLQEATGVLRCTRMLWLTVLV